ncbi:MAG: galactokinase [Acidobacteriota bacterium]
MAERIFAAEAPGRVNLIGEHTDYNGGFVLPAAIPQRTHAILRIASGRRVIARSTNVGQPDRDSYVLEQEERKGTWIDYLQGITDVLRREGFRLSGFELEIASEVPIGSGLSSSAALEIATLRALRDAFSLDLPDVRMALLARRAENEFVGAPVGIMDQMACTLADEHTALFLDTRTLEYRRVPVPDAAELVVINSGVAHNHAAGDYRTRRAECEEAARRLGVRELRDCDLGDLARVARLPDPFSRRAKHVITENARVLETVDAFDHGNLARVGQLFDESHASMRDDFNVSVPEIDQLVQFAGECAEVYGARLTGGGFGGSIVALVQLGTARSVAERVVERYRATAKCAPSVLVPLSATRAPLS